MHPGFVRSSPVLRLDAMAGHDRQGVLREDRAQGVGRLPRPLQVAPADGVGRLDSHPYRRTVRFALRPDDEVGGVDTGFLLVVDVSRISLGLPGRAKKIHERVCRYGDHVPIREVWRARTMTGAVRRGPDLSGTPGTCGASNTSNEKTRS